MGIYIGQFVCIAVFTILSRYVDKKSKKVLFAIGCFSILFLTIFRDVSVGADTRNYCNGFKYITTYVSWENILKFRWEPGYVVLNKIIGFFSTEPQTLIIVLGIIILIPLYKILWDESKIPCMSLLLFIGMGLWENSTFIYRQWCAMIILLTWGVKYVLERKLLKFLLSVLGAMLFHRTAIIFILLYFIYDIKINQRFLMYSVVASVVLGAVGKPILLPIMNMFARIPEQSSYNGGIPMLIFLWFSVWIIYLFAKRQLIHDKFKLYFCMVLIAAVVQPIAFTFSNWARVVAYFSIAICIIIPNTLEKILQQKNNRQVASIVDGCLIGLIFIWYYLTGIDSYTFMQI